VICFKGKLSRNKITKLPSNDFFIEAFGLYTSGVKILLTLLLLVLCSRPIDGKLALGHGEIYQPFVR
jgi:hypothetical protein